VSPESGRWQTLERLFHEALEQPQDVRARFLETACGADAQLRAELERLLGADEIAHARIERIVADGAARAADALIDLPGALIGPYRLIETLGQGGMGAVWLAEAAPAARAGRVALKLIRPEIASPDIIRRFRSEQHILANLRHPNIAQLVSGGTTDDGRPYFVMEYIEGERIDDWCCDRGLRVDARIALFLAVCAAVHYAHANGVVHRDLKPGNILVTRDGTPKLLDFGIAKILGRSSHAIQTAPGVRMMTPHYASPEQVRGSPVSPATDVYALGVVLYELLTEQLPYRIEKNLPHLLANAILAQEPLPPSAMVHSQELREHLAGELDHTLLTALNKEPERRHASVEVFANALRRRSQLA
jgi:serine/threonine protein kinase